MKKASISKESKETTDIKNSIAEIVHDYCFIPGCYPRLHLEEASDILDRLRRDGYIKEETKNRKEV
jgi:hypothetical protein